VKLLTLAEVADRLAISRRHAYRLSISLPVVRIGRCLRVDEADLEDFIRKNRTPWDDSSSAPKMARGGATGRTREDDASSEACGPVTEPSPASDYVRPSWLRPMRTRGGRNA
jgi:excisionase family DNA binding protein